jgi:Uma2 family endonuclease
MEISVMSSQTHAPIQADVLSLALPHDLVLYVTQEQFEVLAAANRDLRLERTSAGELIMNPPTGGESGYRNVKISYFLVKWVEEEGGHGIPFDSSTGFRLPNGADRSPDASWVSGDRWRVLTLEQQRGFVPLCPDFVVELHSASDSLSKLQVKMQEYIENSARLGWLIDPQNQQVEIYRPKSEVEVLKNPALVSGEDVLSGFVLNLSRIWG